MVRVHIDAGWMIMPMMRMLMVMVMTMTVMTSMIMLMLPTFVFTICRKSNWSAWMIRFDSIQFALLRYTAFSSSFDDKSWLLVGWLVIVDMVHRTSKLQKMIVRLWKTPSSGDLQGLGRGRFSCSRAYLPFSASLPHPWISRFVVFPHVSHHFASS